MSILLSAIFIFHGLILLLVAETSEQHRYLVILIIILNIGFQRKNRFWKTCSESQDINKKVSKISLPNQTTKIWHILTDISGLGAYFSKLIFALKPWVRAGQFEYHEPYNPINFFSPLKGSEPFCQPWERCSRKSEKN